jgi:hypothetical protein
MALHGLDEFTVLEAKRGQGILDVFESLLEHRSKRIGRLLT